MHNSRESVIVLRAGWWHQSTLRGYQVVKLVKEVGSGVNDSPPKLLSLLRDPMITRLVVELQIDSPASVSGISRPLWKYKEERLKWRVQPKTTKKTCFTIWQVSSTRSAPGETSNAGPSGRQNASWNS